MSAAGRAATVGDRVAAIRARIDVATRVAGRDPASVTLIGVTKAVAAATAAQAYAAGLRDFGENRAADLLAKAAALPADCRWHMIGALQTNKVRLLAGRVHRWHTVDRQAVVDELARRAPGADVLIEVNVGEEPQKAGCKRHDLDTLAARTRASGLGLRGLMCVPPVGVDPRPHFAWLRDAAARLGLGELSMGMSGDFEAAVAEGATLVRVGSAIFGPRPGSGGARDYAPDAGGS